MCRRSLSRGHARDCGHDPGAAQGVAACGDAGENGVVLEGQLITLSVMAQSASVCAFVETRTLG